MRSNEIDQLAAALAAFQAEVTVVPKDEVNTYYKSKYAPLDKVVVHAQPLLTKHGLAVTQMPTYIQTDTGITDALQTILFHTSSGQFIESTMRLHVPKDDPQAQGSAITYGRRYAFMAILGLVADDEDDDANAASSPKAAPPVALGGVTRRRAPTTPTNPPSTETATTKAPTPGSESPPEARVSAADAKRELIDHAISLGWNLPDSREKAKVAWADQGSESILRGELNLRKMSIEKAPA